MSDPHDPQPSASGEAAHAPLIEHLIELRSRLLRATVVVLVVFAALYGFSNQIYLYVSEPLMALLPPGSQMIATEVASPFTYWRFCWRPGSE